MIFGFKNNKCKENVYTEEEVNRLLANTEEEMNTLLANKIDKSVIIVGVDINTINDTCYNYCTGCINVPTGGNGYLFTQKYTDTYLSQSFKSSISGTLYERVKVKDVWSDWVQVITKGDFAVLTGNMTLEPATDEVSETTQIDLNLPTGFTNDNSVVISQGIKLSASSIGFAYGNTDDEEGVMDLVLGLFPYKVYYTADGKLRIEIDNRVKQESAIKYRIVLMKI